MPELPEVEAMRATAEAQALGRTVAQVEIPDPEVLDGLSPDDLRDAAQGRPLAEATRHGKLLFLRLGEGPWLTLHFGMTGDLVVIDRGAAPPEHARLSLVFEDGGRLVLDDPRRFGRAELAEDVAACLEAHGIGPDALRLGPEDLARIIGGTHGQVKPALMDQSKLAGIGNLHADEILLRAGIRPDARADALDAGRLRALHAALREALETAAARLRAGEGLPPDGLAARREAGGTCPRCGGALEAAKVSGRTAWFCPRCQTGADG